MPLVDVVADGHRATLTLNRPEARNALSVELCDAIVDALSHVRSIAEARVVVLEGAGKAFCAGADIAAVSGDGALEFLPAFERMLESVARFHLPVVAALHGAALGGGLQLATVCDFRIAADETKIGIPSSRLGIVVNLENVERLVLLAGVATAKEVLMTGRTFSGHEAAAAGLVHNSVPGSELAAAVDELAGRVAGAAPLSVQGAKRTIQAVVDNLGGTRSARPDDAAEVDRLLVDAYRSADLTEGIRALAERRPPRFEGR